MNKEDRKSRFSLTILFACVILIFMIISLVISGVIGYLLVKFGIISVIDETTLSLQKVLALLSINSLVLGGVLSFTASKILLMPINKIITKMNRLASGDYKVRLDFKGPLAGYPTTKEITNSFNQMAEALETTEMLRSDSINNFSHEFKTPIVSIAGFAKLLKRGNLTEEQKAEYIAVIEEESLRLSSMATNVLNLTKYENQEFLTDITEFNLSEQLRSSILALEGKWTKKNIDFNLNFIEYIIEGDKEMLKHVWINLIDNAIKFSADGGVVKIEIQEVGCYYSVLVSNYGEEIPEAQIKKIFNKFYQVDESHSTKGNGIGLALVKSVTELHKGTVSVESQNGMTTFRVLLPKKQKE